MFEPIRVQSHKGIYSIHWGLPFAPLQEGLKPQEFLVVDQNVVSLYSSLFEKTIESDRCCVIEAAELNKSIGVVSQLAQRLIQCGVERGDTLIAVGGGVIADIVSFLASILLRGIRWEFYPTTLLAQADSCIGGKGAVNVGEYKNLLGSFYPPESIWISPEVLQTLSPLQFSSGLGEVIKAHLIGGEEDFYWLAENYASLAKNHEKLTKAIYRSLVVKKGFVEADEWDQRERRLLNYGHTFGHALESATQFTLPHGIAVRIGIDMANFISWQTKLLSQDLYEKIHDLLWIDQSLFPAVAFSQDIFWDALKKDKKNIDEDLFLILTQGPGRVFGKQVTYDASFRSLCLDYLQGVFQTPLPT